MKSLRKKYNQITKILCKNNVNIFVNKYENQSLITLEWIVRLSGEQSAWNVTKRGQEIVASPFLFLMLLIEPKFKINKTLFC